MLLRNDKIAIVACSNAQTLSNKEKINELDNELNEIIKYQLNNFKEELEKSRTRKKAYSSYSRANMTNNIYSTRV